MIRGFRFLLLVLVLAVPLQAQQYFTFKYGPGPADGNSAFTAAVSATVSITRSGTTDGAYIVKVLAVNAGTANFIVWKNPAVVLGPSGSPTTEFYPFAGSDTYTVSPGQDLWIAVRISLNMGASKMYFGGRKITLNVPDTSNTSVKVTNPLGKTLHVDLYGIKSDGTLEYLSRNNQVGAYSTANLSVHADRNLYPGGVHVGAYYEDSQLDGSANVVDGSGTVAFSLGDVPWQQDDKYVTTAPLNTAPIPVDTSAAPTQLQQTGASTIVKASGDHITDDQIKGTSGTVTDAATKQSIQTAANGIIDAVTNAGAKVVSAVNNIKITSTSGGGGSTDMTATNGKLDTANVKLEDIKGKLDTVKTSVDAVKTAQDKGRPGSATVDLSAMTSESEQADATAAMGTQLSSVNGATSSQSTTLQGYGNGVGTVDASGAGSGSVSLGSLDVDGIGLHKELDVDVLTPWLRPALLYVREAFLWGLAYLFLRAISASVQKYQIAITHVPQTLTLAGPGELWIPGVGWAKQIGLALSVVGFIAIHVAALVVAGNTKLGEITGSWTLTNIANVVGVMTSGGSAAGGTAYRVVDMFFPVRASVQFGLSWLSLTWLQMGLYFVASSQIKATRV